MAIKIYRDGNMVIVEDGALEDAHAPVPGIRTSYFFDPPGSDNVIIMDDFRATTMYAGLITGITKDDDTLIADKASGKTYLNSTLG